MSAIATHIAPRFLARHMRRGVGMIEALFVLGFAVMFVLGAIYLFSLASGSDRARKAGEHVQNMYSIATQMVNGRADLLQGASSLNLTSPIAQAGLLANNLVIGTEIRNPFPGGGRTWVELRDSTALPGGVTANNQAIFVVLTGVPAEECVRLMSTSLKSIATMVVPGHTDASIPADGAFVSVNGEQTPGELLGGGGLCAAVGPTGTFAAGWLLPS